MSRHEGAGARGAARCRLGALARGLRTGWSVAARSLGVIVVLLVLNEALGWGWDAATGSASSPPVAQRILVGEAPAPAKGSAPTQPLDPLAASPQLRGYPWAREFFREFADAADLYAPFRAEANGDFRGRYLNVDDGVRRSYEPKVAAGHPAPTLTFYGGSTMWGEAQRDGWTIPSVVARLAAAAGFPIRVVNRGVRGYVSWDEALLFEDDLANRPRPDFAVFYDGWNDTSLQSLAEVVGQPTQYLVTGVRGRLAARDKAERQALSEPGSHQRAERNQLPARTALRDLWNRYQRHSLVQKFLGKVHDLFATAPAGAAALPQDTATDRAGRAAARVYLRARRISLALAADHRVRPVFFWQPQQNTYDPTSPRHAADPLVRAPTINIADAMGDRAGEVYLDGGHTNELGARLVAEAMWKHLEPLVRAWYRAHG